MNILVIGNGGREHALVWKLRQSPRVEKIFCAPGNAGIAELAECVDIAPTNVSALLECAQKEKIDLTVVGPEQPLVEGVVDRFRRNGLPVFGPTREASILESSKVFSKEFCLRYNIPTARAKICEDVDTARAFAATQPFPLVVKADGLCAGKGVVVCQTLEEAHQALHHMMIERGFGDAGKKVVIEECLRGEEASFLVLCDGNHVLPLASSQDHKRLLDGDRGPNTGGMGAYSPAPVVTPEIYEKVMERIMIPAARGMVTEGRTFTGILYAGLMINEGEPKVLEFNVRFGDPEAQPLLVRLKNDLADLLLHAVNGTLDRIHLEWDPKPAVCVVMASEGYPEHPKKGAAISGLQNAHAFSDVVLFHAGTARREKKIVTHGGRVLGVTALGQNLRVARDRAYAVVEKISWEGCHYRKDIAARALS